MGGRKGKRLGNAETGGHTIANGVDFVHSVLIGKSIESCIEAIQHVEYVRSADRCRHICVAHDIREQNSDTLMSF